MLQERRNTSTQQSRRKREQTKTAHVANLASHLESTVRDELYTVRERDGASGGTLTSRVDDWLDRSVDLGKGNLQRPKRLEMTPTSPLSPRQAWTRATSALTRQQPTRVLARDTSSRY